MTSGAVKNGLVVLAVLIAAILGFFGYRAANPPAVETAATTAPTAPAAAPAPEGAAAPLHLAAPGAPVAAEGESAAPRRTGSTSFDIVRVEPTGEAVVAGRAEAGTTVELLRNGEPIAEEIANDAGEFVIIPPPLGKGDHQLALRVKSDQTGESRSDSTVIVSIPDTGGVLVVESAPGQPSSVLQQPGAAAQAPDAAARGAEQAVAAAAPDAGAPAAAAPDTAAQAQPAPSAVASAESGLPAADLSAYDGGTPALPGSAPVAASATPVEPLHIGAVDVEDGRLIVQGQGPAGAVAQIYLNDAPVAQATIGEDKRWSLTIQKGMMPGNYRIRIDQVEAGGVVVARAEVPFVYEADVAAQTQSQTQAQPQASAPAPGAPAQATPDVQQPVPSAAQQADTPAVGQAPAAPEAGAAPASSGPRTTASMPPADAVVSQLETVTVQRGDSLWRISRNIYGQGVRYTVIYDANDGQIRNPNLIYPGQVFVIPGASN